jgi:hypothetical protein
MERSPGIERLARHLFDVDEQFNEDRKRFVSFDRAPSGLQDWWRDRAERHMELQRDSVRSPTSNEP